MNKDALRKQIKHIDDQLIKVRQQAQIDLQRLSAYEDSYGPLQQLDDVETHSQFQPSIGQEIDLFRMFVSGYSSQVKNWAKIMHNAEEAQQRLERNTPFTRRHFNRWYVEDSDDFPALKRYVELVDYLRLLVLQYMRLYQDE